MIEQTRRAKQRLTRITRALAARERSLEALADEAEQSTLALEQAAKRAVVLPRQALSSQRRLNATRDRLARAAGARGRRQARGRLAPQPAVGARRTPLARPPPRRRTHADGARDRLLAPGHAPRRAPVGWGVVAVDPS